jgi:hypothetical protein
MSTQKSYGFRPKLNGKIRGGNKNLTSRIVFGIGVVGTLMLLSSLDSCKDSNLENSAWESFYGSNSKIGRTYLNENNASASENLVKYID